MTMRCAHCPARVTIDAAILPIVIRGGVLCELCYRRSEEARSMGKGEDV